MKDTITLDQDPPNPAYPWLVTSDNGSRTWHSSTRESATEELATHRDARNQQRTELAATIAVQAQAIADGTVIGPQHGAVARLRDNVNRLAAWTADDRTS